MSVKVIVADKWINCERQLGTFMEDTDYDILVQEDMDFYAPSNSLEGSGPGEDTIIFKFRKNVFTEEEQRGAYEGLALAAQPTQNRGIAAGPKEGKLNNRDWATGMQLDIMNHYISGHTSLMDDDPVQEIVEAHKKKGESSRGLVWLRNKISDAGYTYEEFFKTKMEEWAKMSPEEAKKDAKITRDTFVSDTTYANQVNSGLAGFFDRYPRIPYGRATSYTERFYERYEKCFPYMERLAQEFEKLLPERYNNQLRCAETLDERFRVAGTKTPFTTITVNKNFRTAAHRDAGDLSSGFSNLTVVANDKDWEGGYLVLPEFRVAVDLRPGDLLLINNHEGIHGNTEIIPPAGKTIEEMERISLVCYFREKMMELGSWEYEQLRRKFVDDRRTNPDHPQQRKLWNGISEGMWTSAEWYDYLRANGGESMLTEYHPEAVKQTNSLEDFFS